MTPPLYGGRRDISLFRSINRELINRIITTPVDIYKPSLSDTKENIYGESEDKVWLLPVRICSLIEHLEQEKPYNEAGIVDVKQNPVFHFLLDDIKHANLKLDEGDIIHWNDIFWEVDRTLDTQQYMTKDPDTQKELMGQYEAANWGWRVSVACYTNMSRRTRLSLEKTRAGGAIETVLQKSSYQR